MTIDARLARSYGPTRPQPKFKFRIDLTPGGLVAKPQFIDAADAEDALDRLSEKMGPVPYEVDGRPFLVGTLR